MGNYAGTAILLAAFDMQVAGRHSRNCCPARDVDHALPVVPYVVTTISAPLALHRIDYHFFSKPSSLQRALTAAMSSAVGHTIGGKRAPPKSGSGS